METLHNIISAFRFASSFLALGAALVFLPLLIFFLRRRKPEEHSHLEFLRRQDLKSRVWQKIFFVLPCLALISALIAVSSPQIAEEIKTPLVARDIIVVLDTSGSMIVGFYPDEPLPKFEKTRLGVAQKFLKEFFKEREGDRIAVILYDNPRGYIARPFTDDQGQLQSLFSREEIRGVYEAEDILSAYVIHRGTNTRNGLELAWDYFVREGKSKDKLIVLVTDLDDDYYEVPEAIQETRKRGINVYTIGIVAGGSHHRVEDIKKMFKDEGVKFFYVEREEDLRSALATIDQIEKSEVEINKIVSLKSISWIFIISALFFSGLFMVLGEISKRIP